MKCQSPQAEPTQAPLMFGAPVFKSCDHCAGPIRILPLESGHALGGTLWSDGYMQTPQLPEQPLLGRCPGCSEILCLAELATYPEPQHLTDPDAADFVRLTLADYRALLTQLDSIDRHYHVYLRMKYWQEANHPRRLATHPIPLNDEERANLQALAGLLGEDEPDRLLLAELLRQLGAFARASAVLSDPFQQRLQHLVVGLKRLVDANDPYLAMLCSGQAGSNPR